jgi:membrane associated rhomboid family serine protease
MVCQILMLDYTGASQGAGGASGAIYGLLMIAWLWAPQNCVEFAFILGWLWAGSFEVTIQTVALFYVGMDLFSAWLSGFEMSTPVLHLLGAAAGFPIGLVFLKKDWVDCEGWDLLSLRGGKSPRR